MEIGTHKIDIDDCEEQVIGPKANDLEPGVSDQLLVIGAGLMRTGTSSLKQALETLYGKRCYHMREIFFNYKTSHIQKWLRKFGLRGNFDVTDFWDTVYAGCIAAVDYPTCVFYKELLDIYPNAKVILTVRDPVEWAQSCKATTLSHTMLYEPTLGERLVYLFHGLTALPELHDAMFKRTLGPEYATMNEHQLAQAFERWNDKVKSCVPEDRLLVFDVRQGWKPLCEFLGVAEPEGVAFPHLNDREKIQQTLSPLIEQGRKMNGHLVNLAIVTGFLVIIVIWWIF